VDRREHRALAADRHVARGIARMLDVLSRRALLDDRARHPPREMDARAPHIGAGLFPQFEALVVAMEFDADLLENSVGIVLDDLQPLLAQYLDHRRLAADERQLLDLGAAAGRPARLGAATRAAAGRRHLG